MAYATAPAPSATAGQRDTPRSSSPPRATPDGNHTGQMWLCSAASDRATLAATRYTAASARTSTRPRTGNAATRA
ncbi:hypothetical protein COEX109129_14290 [Corallococcus exiguus]